MMAFAKQVEVTNAPHSVESVPTRVFWGCHDSPMGPIMLGVSDKGLCKIEFASGAGALYDLSRWREEWPDTEFLPDSTRTTPIACRISQIHSQNISPASIALYGTAFQLNVLKTILKLPDDRSMSYAEVIRLVGKPVAA